MQTAGRTALFAVRVTGPSASLVDTKASLSGCSRSPARSSR
jgi:hypothetical protein